MKQEATKKSKKWIWLVAALAALVVIAGVVLALFLLPGQQGGPGATGGRAELYFNIDREIFTKDAEMGFSTREKGDDGLYHIRFAYNGEQVELPVSDKRLVNFIDTMDIVALVKDADGMIVDAKAPKDVAFVIAEGYFVRKAEGDIIQANSSMAMNGMDANIKLNAAAGVYDVTPEAEVVGQVGTPQVLDEIYVYGDLETQEVTHVFITEHPVDGEVYWRVDRFYDTATAKSTRVPDANGVYTILFACNGEQVELKCKDQIVVNAIDGLAPLGGYMTLMFDEEGYIIDMEGATGVAMVLRGKQLGANYRIEAVDGNTITATKVDSGNDQGKTIQFTYDDSLKTYLVDSATCDKFVGEVATEFKVNDAITIWSDLEGKPIYCFILDRLVPGPMYFNIKKATIDAETGLTTRLPDEKGYYVYEMLADRELVTVRTKDINIATLLDRPPVYTYDSVMGLELDGDIVKRVYDASCVSGMWPIGYQRYLTNQSGPVYTFAASDNLENFTNIMLAPDVKIIDVSGADYYGVEMGSETKLNLWDRATVYRNIYGEANYVYVSHRYIEDAELYHIADRQWDATNLVSTREPNEDGYYVFQIRGEDGKLIEAKTKDKGLANYIDKQSPAVAALKISKGIIKGAYPRYSIFKSGTNQASWQMVDWVKKDGTFATWYTHSVTGEKVIGWPYEKKMAKDCKIYNISSLYDEYKFEETDLRVGDQVLCIASNMTQEVVRIYVLQRYVDSPFYWNLDRQYDWTNMCSKRQPDADGYYVFDKLVANGEIKTFRSKNKEHADLIDNYSFAFAMETEGDLIKNVVPCMYIENTRWAVNYYTDVTKVDGNKLSLKMNDASRDNYGETYEMTLAEDVQIWDVSGTAVYNGKQATLTVGDQVVPITNKSDEVKAIFILNKMTRAAGATSYCEHCGEVVTWQAYPAYPKAVDGHYYLSGDMDNLWQATIGAEATADAEQIKSDVVLDLNGKTLTYNRQVFKVYGTLTIVDSVGGGKMVARNEKITNGAAIMVHDGGVLNMYAGTLTMADEAVTNSEGGLVMTNPGGTFNLYGGTLIGGRTNGRGGNVFAYGGTFNMYGGTITGGSAANGPNVHAVDATVGGVGYEGVVNIYGGTITDGGVKAESSADLKVEGKPVIGGSGIRVPMGSLLNVGTLKTGASIVINGDGVFAEFDDPATAEAYEAYFQPARTTDSIDAVGNTLVYTKQKADLTQVSNDNLVFDAGTTKALCPVCGEKVTWKALAAGKNYITDGGHYYLADDLEYTDPAADVGSRGVILRGSTGSGGAACLHLNGHNMTATNTAAISIMDSYELNIMGNGTVSGSSQTWSGNALSITAPGAKVNLIGGTYTKDAAEVNGTIMMIGTNGGTINMYDGAKIDATGKTSSNYAPALTIYGGGTKSATVENDGYAQGYNPAYPAVFNMYGGQILGGTNTYTNTNYNNGGNVMLYAPQATMNILGGTVSGGEYAGGTGDAIAVRDGGTLIVSENATITAGSSGEAIGAVIKENDVTISGTVNGAVNFSDSGAGELVFTGEPVVTGNVVVPVGGKITLSDLVANTSIVVKANGVFAELADSATATTYAGYLDVAKEGDSIAAVDNTLVYTKAPIDFSTVSNDNITLDANNEAVCPACGEKVEWKTLVSGQKNTLAAGHYIVPEGGITWDNANNPLIDIAGGEICLHLNGQNITSTGNHAILVSAACDLNIMGNGTVSGYRDYGWAGAALQVSAAGANVNLIGGTYTKSTNEQKSSVLFLNTAGVINMYSGVTIDGRNCVSSNRATIHMEGTATGELGSAAINVKGATIYAGTYTGTGRGNALSITNKCCTFNMESGTWYLGTAPADPGVNILLANGELTIGENAVLISESGYAINQWAGDNQLNISGHITGRVNSSNATAGKFVLSGTPELNNLTLSGAKVNATGMTGGKVYVSASDVFTAPFIDNAAATAAKAWFESIKADTDIEITTEHELKVISTAAPVTPPADLNYTDPIKWVNESEKTAWCPKCQTIEKWVEITGNGGMKVSSAEDTHFYLSGPYTSTTVAFRAQNANACLHLNGNTLASPSIVVDANTKTLNIMGTGTISTTFNGNYWGAVMAQAGGVANIYGNVTVTKATAAEKTPLIHASGANSTINLEGNVIVGAADLVYSQSNSAAITLRNGGTVNMKNGTVYGGNNTSGVNGSAVAWYTSATETNVGAFNMTGGTIEACTVAGCDDYAILIGTAYTSVTIGENAVVRSAGNAINQWSTSGNVTISGHITGKVQISNAEKGITLSGTPEISNLSLGANVKADVSGMTGGKVYVTASGIFTKPLADATAATAAAARFESLTADTHIATTAAFELQVAAGAAPAKPGVNDALTLDGNNIGWCPVCEADVTWQAVSATADNYLNDGGEHFYIADDNFNGSKTLASITSSVSNKVGCLHLNGKTVTTSSLGANVSGTNNVLNIMGTGTISTTFNGNYWGVLLAQSGGTVNVLSDLTVTKAAAAEKTPLIHATGANSTINLKGNVTVGASDLVYSTGSSAAITLRNGGIVNVENGTVYGGNNTSGASAASAVGWYTLDTETNVGAFNMTGGTIEACTVAGCDDYAILITTSYTSVTIGENAVVKSAGNAINQWSNGGNVTIGGHITGKVQISNADKGITLSGTPELNNLSLGANVKADVSGMTGGSVTLGTTSAMGVFTKACDPAAVIGYFHVADSTTQQIKANPADLELTTPTAQVTPPATLNYTDPIAWVNESEKTAWCPKCQTLETWTEVTSAGATPTTSGHYYLAQDEVAYTGSNAAMYINTAGIEVCLHLNGKTLKGTQASGLWVREASTLNVMGNGTVTRDAADKYSSTVRVTKADAEVNLYAGTYTKAATNDTAMIVFIYGGGEVNQYANTTVGFAGMTVGESATVTLRKNSAGACAYNMYGGTLYGANNTKGAYGSAIEIYDADNSFNLEGGQIIASNVEGSDDYPIYARGAFTGTIGANVTVPANAAGQSFYSAWIASVDLTIAGTVSGSVNCTNFVANLEGQPKLVGAAKVNGLILDNRNTVDATGLTADAEILVDVSAGVNNGIFTKAFTDATAAEAVKDCFTATGVAATVVVDGNTLAVHDLNKVSAANLSLDADNKAYCPVCRETVEWTALTGNGQYLGNGMHYYIADGATITADGNVVQIGGAVDCCLHLNGGNITSTGATAIKSYASFDGTLNIMGTGTITGYAANYWTGSVLHLNSTTNNVNLYGNVKLTKPATELQAPIVYMGMGQVNMYGNCVIGEADVDLTTKTAGVVFMQNNAADEKNATLTMYGGTIYGTDNSTANSGSVIAMANSGTGTYTFNMLGGNVYATDVAASDDYTIYGAKDCVINIGANATVGTTAAGNTFYTGWVGSGIVDITVAGTTEGVWKLNNITAASIDAKFVGDAKATVFLSVTRKIDLTGLTSGAEITLGFTAHETGIFTTAFETKEAAEAVLPCITPADGYQIEVTDAFELKQTQIPASA